MFNLSCFSCVVESEVRQPCLELQLTECAGRGLGCVVDVGEFRTNEYVTKVWRTAESDGRLFYTKGVPFS